MNRQILRPVALIVTLLALCASPAARTVDRRAQYLDAFVDVDDGSGEWTIGNAAVTYTVAIRPNRSLETRGLAIAGTSDPITGGTAPDTVLTVAGATVRLGAPASGFVVESVQASTGSHFVSLAIRLHGVDHGLAVTRHYVVYPGAGAVEMWTSIATLDHETRAVQNLNAYDIGVPAGAIDVVTGLQTPQQDGGAFTRVTRSLQVGERMTIGSATLSSGEFMPYLSIGNGHHRVYGGLLWSGGWSTTLVRDGESLRVTTGLPGMSAWARPGAAVEGPHAFIGATWDRPGADIEAVTRFVHAGRAGREFPALTTFNTWFVHGINIDERTAQRDIDMASAIGVELFQLDAGWYPRRRPRDVFDFTDGLGTWEADTERFPSGLAALADYAHERGMKFGLWVEPARVSLDTVGRPGLADAAFLALQDGHYQPGVENDAARDAQICLADPRARAWVTDRLIAPLEQVRPDNLKWDFNRWVHCTRVDHQHPVNGGNYEHTRALYEILGAVRERFPALTIENCSGGGHRIDFALARLTDTAWMDDRSAPSAHVRRNLNGLLALFPAKYLFSYVMAGGDESIEAAEDIPLLVRSRMPGVVGLATDLRQLGERQRNELHQQIELAKQLRAVQVDATTYALTSQRPGPGEWDVIQQVMSGSGVSIIFAFANGAANPIVVPLRGIRADVIYELRSADRVTVGRLHGADLIAHGLLIAPAPETAAQVLVLEPVGGAATH
ncbi:MAG: alpha-galactosidase [Acidobacteria bacterium]|nr:alpha-galactosidase [Acidobacteriota bacterium]